MTHVRITESTILWRRLDVPGHDACRLRALGDGWHLDGAAVFEYDGEPACFRYHLTCDSAWRSLEGSVRGWMGARPIDLSIERTRDGHWTLNGERASNVDGCLDLDFGFTPATNLSQLRRLALSVRQAADVPVAWLDVATGALDVLYQRYERRDESSYWYEAPRFGYAAVLRLDPTGFVRLYPGLWEALS